MADAAARGGVVPLVYVAGPFAGPTNYDVQQHVARAESFGLTIARQGALPVIPHTMNRNFFGQLDEAFWLAGVIELMRRCDALALTADWPRSKGATIEHNIAADIGMPIFHGEIDGWEARLGEWVLAWKHTHRGISTKAIWSQPTRSL